MNNLDDDEDDLDDCLDFFDSQNMNDEAEPLDLNIPDDNPQLQAMLSLVTGKKST